MAKKSDIATRKERSVRERENHHINWPEWIGKFITI